ncbi:uncharacterized protein A4U43_C07F25470 [Asparagus officinalis]|uniref:Uncharacterized protein n=1 Tax=Asparagus officinalis TaxID=4686 RepID=A0A5P1EI88_ASPOF|nr:uncharacterized protein A4U43_C07F25470 [Asparagus officinalis]
MPSVYAPGFRRPGYRNDLFANLGILIILPPFTLKAQSQESVLTPASQLPPRPSTAVRHHRIHLNRNLHPRNRATATRLRRLRKEAPTITTRRRLLRKEAPATIK